MAGVHAVAVERFTFSVSHHINSAVLLVGLQNAVDGRQGHGLTGLANQLVELLGGDELFTIIKHRIDNTLLAGIAAFRCAC